MDSLSVFIFPLVFILTLGANLVHSQRTMRPEVLKSLWLYIHVPTTFLGYAALFVAFAVGIMYLIQEKELKRKRPQAFYYRLPSLEVCDELGYRALGIGFLLADHRDRGGRLLGQQISERLPGSAIRRSLWSYVTWLIYAVLLHYRLSAGWRGRRAAWMSVIGFIIVLAAFFGTRHQGSAHTFILQ